MINLYNSKPNERATVPRKLSELSGHLLPSPCHEAGSKSIFLNKVVGDLHLSLGNCHVCWNIRGSIWKQKTLTQFLLRSREMEF
jgi:hypothetical protein